MCCVMFLEFLSLRSDKGRLSRRRSTLFLAVQEPIHIVGNMRPRDMNYVS